MTLTTMGLTDGIAGTDGSRAIATVASRDAITTPPARASARIFFIENRTLTSPGCLSATLRSATKGSATDFSLFRGSGSIGFLLIVDPFVSRQSRNSV
jgi:hypothetical protein